MKEKQKEAEKKIEEIIPWSWHNKYGVREREDFVSVFKAGAKQVFEEIEKKRALLTSKPDFWVIEANDYKKIKEKLLGSEAKK